jgi:hypothetical protein
MYVNNLIPVEDVLIRTEIAEISFACDLKKCKGACCTIESEYGAPLLKEEIGQIESILDIIKEYLTKKHRLEIEDNGFYESKDDELLTLSIENKACVFVFFEKSVAKCSIEKAFIDGKTKFRKPLSCHLFPIRVSRFGGDVLRFEKFKECSPALENGAKNSIKLVDFCKDSLERLYGKKWYSKLKETIGIKNVNT